jgi:hypothetical protein
VITSKELGERSVDKLPIPTEFFEIIHNISLFLLRDDISDLGRFSYYDREDHYYHGNKSTDHPSMMHHWQIGIVGLVVSQFGSLLNIGKDIYDDYKGMKEGRMNDEVRRILDNDTSIPLDDYKAETSSLPIVIEEDGGEGIDMISSNDGEIGLIDKRIVNNNHHVPLPSIKDLDGFPSFSFNIGK